MIDWTTSFFSDPNFYYLLVLGGMAMIPRARYTADRAAALSDTQAQQIKPNLAQRVCVFIPGICVFACIGMFRYALGAIALLVLFMVIYIGLILMFKASTPR